MVRDSRYVTNTAYSGAKSLVISRFRCTTQERGGKATSVSVRTYAKGETVFNVREAEVRYCYIYGYGCENHD